MAERKISGGKLIRIDVSDDGSARITGDFFLHPEKLIAELEACLQPGLSVLQLVAKLDMVLARGQLIGASSADIAQLYLEALE